MQSGRHKSVEIKDIANAVRAWEQELIIPTYPAAAPDPNPMFLEKRVYQGSSGKVYPNPFTDRVAREKTDKTYHAVMLENEFVQLMILPEIGGRIHIGFDKTNQYDFFYRQNVIKPALVGLLGPWISGGVEFNWPQHHRPSTFMPVHHTIERSEDGSCTVWLSEHEPMNRMKGMVGICLRRGRSLIEAKVRLYNRTPMAQTFLWWSNVAVRVHDQYQTFFPSDVTFVMDHGKRAVSSFPIARNFYYGVDYREGVDISWYKNIPVPTSYMVTKSKFDFFGGYDFSKQAGFVAVANHHIAPGKKLWTWGNGEFGHAWDRNLTDNDGPYIELMAGAYTDNQPDFSWLQPYETRTFSQFWYPIQKIGPARNANQRAAIHLSWTEKTICLGVCTSGRETVVARLSRNGISLYEQRASLQPGTPLVAELPNDEDNGEGLHLEVFDASGKLVIEWRPETPAKGELPEPASEPSDPADVKTIEELYLIGLHLKQYRHATRDPESYWKEGLRRDPQDSRLHNAMGLAALQRGEFSRAESHFRSAVSRQTMRNPNPYDGECFYNLGVALRYLGREDAAYDAFYKAVWNYAWRSAGYYSLASIDAGKGNTEQALQHLHEGLLTNTQNLKARGLRASLLRRLERNSEAEKVLDEITADDPLDLRSSIEQHFLRCTEKSAHHLLQAFAGDLQSVLDLAYDYAAEGFAGDAIRLLEFFQQTAKDHHPMLLYSLSWLHQRRGELVPAEDCWRKATAASSVYCFPSRLEEMVVLEAMRLAHPDDAKAAYYLGNLYYDKRRHEEAINCWRDSVSADPGFSIPWRNLAIGEFNIHGNTEAALAGYQRAFAAAPKDARIFYEWDQLRKRTGESPELRLTQMEKHADLCEIRDDLAIEYITLLNQTGDSEQALQRLESRHFSPWEGGEGLVSTQFVFAHMHLGRTALQKRSPRLALDHFYAARCYPENLGEGKHLLTLERDIDYFTGLAWRDLGDSSAAREAWEAAAAPIDNPLIHPGRQHYFRALALRRLGRAEDAEEELQQLRSFAGITSHNNPRIDYFATSLPNLLLFEDDLGKQNAILSAYLTALAELGFGNFEEAMRLLQQVLEAAPDHLDAREDLRFLSQPGASQADPETVAIP